MKSKAALVLALAVQAACSFLLGLGVLNLYGAGAFASYGAVVGVCAPVFILFSLNLPRLAVVCEEEVVDRLVGVFNAACAGAVLVTGLISASFIEGGLAVVLGLAMKFHADALQKMHLSLLYRRDHFGQAFARVCLKVAGLLGALTIIFVTDQSVGAALLLFGAASYLGSLPVRPAWRFYLPKLALDRGFVQEGGWGTLVNFILSLFLQFPKYLFVATSDVAALAEYTLKLNFVSSVGVFVRNLLNVILRSLKTVPSMAGTQRIVLGTIGAIGLLNGAMGGIYWVLLSRQIITIDLEVTRFLTLAILLSVTNALLGLISTLFLVEGWKKWEAALLVTVLGAALAVGLTTGEVHVLWPAAQALCAVLLLTLWRRWRRA